MEVLKYTRSGCINRRDYFKPTFKNSNAAKKRDSKVLPGKPNHMTSVIQNLQNVSGVFEMTDSTASTTIKNTEKIQVGVSPKVLSATISTQPKLVSIATQSNHNAPQSQLKPLQVAPAPSLSLKKIVALRTSDTLLHSYNRDINLMNCGQACASLRVCGNLDLSYLPDEITFSDAT
ncbi:hypothetical protein ACLB2K_069396 [Fragaria x ananassa]